MASPQVTLQAVVVSFPRPPPGSNLTQELFSIIVANSIRWADEGWGGLANGFTAIYVNPLISQAQAAESMKPLIDFGNRVKSENNMKSPSVVPTEFPSWGTFFNFFANGFVAVSNSLVGIHHMADVRACWTLLPGCRTKPGPDFTAGQSR